MTGKYKAFGEAVMRGIQLALKGSDIELVVKDTPGRREPRRQGGGGARLRRRAPSPSSGPLLADDTRRAALVAEELQVPHRSPSPAREGITDIGPHVFRNMLTNSAQAEALADYATNVLGYKSFGVLYPNIPYGVELANDVLGRRCAAARRHDARRGELRPRPDDLHHRGARSWSAATTSRTAPTTSRSVAGR